MNDLLLNDTFDNFSFSSSGKIVQKVPECKGYLELQQKFNNKVVCKAGNGDSNISFDDSIFLNDDSSFSSFTNTSSEFEDTKNETETNEISKRKETSKVINQSVHTKLMNTIHEDILNNISNSEAVRSLNEENINHIINDSSIVNIENTVTVEESSEFNQITKISAIYENDEDQTGINCNNSNKIVAHLALENITENAQLSFWGLPDIILEKYKKRNITQMFPWQVECLNNTAVMERNKNLVYSAPTSAGKTLVAEILAIKTILERRKKVLFILPFVSVVREKMFYFQDILGTSGVRVEGFMGSYNPPGGFRKIQVAICTIEKANSLVNRLLEEGKLHEVGAVIVDELHLLGDPSRGYLLELLLTKLRYMSLKSDEINIQIIGMSATLPNLPLLATWLDAELYSTSFRPIPLYEQCQVSGEIYNNKLVLERKLISMPELDVDTDNVLQLCLETINRSCSVLIFCPTKNWCENLAQQIGVSFWKLGCSKTPLGNQLRKELNPLLITECLEQLRRCPVGLDEILGKTVSFGVAFHHAGLTMDERDIIEGAFRGGCIRVLVATSTLSSGVNLPARRVIIRTPMFHGKPIDTLTYRQMIGRAGRMGKDTEGDSILICQKNDYRIAKQLMSAELRPIESCLEGAGKLKRAILEVVASEVASSPEEIDLFTRCTLLANDTREMEIRNPIEESLDFLIRNEFIRLQVTERGTSKYVATSLAKACLSSSLPPEEGLALFTELERARQCFVLETDLHIIYLVTPYSVCNQLGTIDWMQYLDMWEKLPASMKRVGELVGVNISYIINGTRGKIQTNTSKLYHKLQVHKRFYTALALQDLVNEITLNEVATKFGCNRGMLQSLQQSAATFAGMVTSFSKQLGWTTVELIVSQFQGRLQFGVSKDLLDLMRLPMLNGQRARALFDAEIETLIDLANTEVCTLENILHKAKPFESAKERDGESEYAAAQRNKLRTIWVSGKQGLTEREAAQMLIDDARTFLRLELGLCEAKWENTDIGKSEKSTTESYEETNEDALKNEETKIGIQILKDEKTEQIRIANIGLNNAEILPKPLEETKIDKKTLKESQIVVKRSGKSNSFEKSTKISEQLINTCSTNLEKLAITSVEESKVVEQLKTHTKVFGLSMNTLAKNVENTDVNCYEDEVFDLSAKTFFDHINEQRSKSSEVLKTMKHLKMDGNNDDRNENLGDAIILQTPIKEGKILEEAQSTRHLKFASKIPKKSNINKETFKESKFPKTHNQNNSLQNVTVNESVCVREEQNGKNNLSNNHTTVNQHDSLPLKTPSDTITRNMETSTPEIKQSNSINCSYNLQSHSLKERSLEFSETLGSSTNLNENIIMSPETSRLDENKANTSDKSMFSESFDFDSKLLQNLSEIENKGKLNESNGHNVNMIVSLDVANAFATTFECSGNPPKSLSSSLDKSKNDDIVNTSTDEVEISLKSLKRSQINVSEDAMAESPKKKFRTSKKSQRTPSANVGAAYIISAEKSVQNGVNFREKDEVVDPTNIEIINVCENKELFATFCKKLLLRDEIALSVGCERAAENKPLIGSKVLNNGNNLPCTEDLQHKDVCIRGVSLTWDGTWVHHIDFKATKIIRNDEKINLLRSILNNDKLNVKIFDSKEQIKVLKKICDIDFNCVCEDPKVGDWLLDPEGREKNLEALTVTYAGEVTNLCTLAGGSKGIGSISLNIESCVDARIRASIECLVCWYLMKSLKARLSEQGNLTNTFGIEMRCMLILSKMELTGFGVDLSELEKLADEFKNQISAIESRAFEMAGRHFSFVSSKDVAQVLGIYRGKRVSTNKQVLEQNEHPISKLIMLWRKLNCSLTKMVYPLLKLVEKNRIHGTCIIHNATGRISMQEPNLQNVPKDFSFVNPATKTNVNVCCRKVFAVTNKNVLISADYCQIELRILAHLSNENTLCTIMQRNTDIFRSIAAKWNSIAEDSVTESIRQQTKEICYGIIYGIGMKTLGEHLNVTEEEAARFTEQFHEKYPALQSFINETIMKCRETGYVETIAGRRRYLPHINSSNPRTKSQAERQAVNTTVQGSAADLVKNAMVLLDDKINDKFRSSRNKPKLVLHMHDELIYEVSGKYLQVFSKLLKKCMQDSIKLSIPFPVKVKSGRSWGELKELRI